MDAPVEAGTVLGSVTVSVNGTELGTVDLAAITTVVRSEITHRAEETRAYVEDNWWKWLVGILLLIVFVILFCWFPAANFYRRRERKRKVGRPPPGAGAAGAAGPAPGADAPRLGGGLEGGRSGRDLGRAAPELPGVAAAAPWPGRGTTWSSAWARRTRRSSSSARDPASRRICRASPLWVRRGQLLDEMLSIIGLGRHNCYITNIVKCRPPGNRGPPGVRAGRVYPLPPAADQAAAAEDHRLSGPKSPPSG